MIPFSGLQTNLHERDGRLAAELDRRLLPHSRYHKRPLPHQRERRHCRLRPYRDLVRCYFPVISHPFRHSPFPQDRFLQEQYSVQQPC